MNRSILTWQKSNEKFSQIDQLNQYLENDPTTSGSQLLNDKAKCD